MAGQEMLHKLLGCDEWVHVILFFDNEELESELHVNLKVMFFIFTFFGDFSSSNCCLILSRYLTFKRIYCMQWLFWVLDQY